MLFSSAIFLFLFLPVVLGAYYLAPKYLRNAVLFLASLLFYTWGEKKYVVIMLFSALVDFSCGLLIARGNRKLGLVISLFVNISLLAVFKYFTFIIDNIKAPLRFFTLDYLLTFEELPAIALPLGISFYTFQTMSYTIDVFRGHVKANKNFIDFGAYVTMFPQLVAGPIVRYLDIKKQLREKHISVANFSSGVERFVIGLAKKILIANTCAAIADNVFAVPTADLSTLWAWIGIIAYAFQIYYDFSGYSDMAIGLGKMFGFDFPENFNFPYISRSIREFWRRWHISLSTWFRDYLYIPLGGSRVKPYRIYVNLFIVFFVTGLWHGASWNFVVWGLFHGAFMIFERLGLDKIIEKVWPLLQHVYALFVVLIGWVFFRATDLGHALDYCLKMFSFSEGDAATLSYLRFFHINSETLLIGLIALLFSMPVYHYLKMKFKSIGEQHPSWQWLIQMSGVMIIFFLFVLSAVFVAADTYNPFIYFRF